MFEVVRDEDESLHPGARGVSADAVREIAGRGAGERREAELARLGRGDGDDAVFERPGRVGAVVLEVEVLEAQFLAEVRP